MKHASLATKSNYVDAIAVSKIYYEEASSNTLENTIFESALF